jgi:hypothetical protein
VRSVPGKMGYRAGMAGHLDGLPEGVAPLFAEVAAGTPPVWIAGFCRDAAGVRAAAERLLPLYPDGRASLAVLSEEDRPHPDRHHPRHRGWEPLHAAGLPWRRAGRGGYATGRRCGSGGAGRSARSRGRARPAGELQVGLCRRAPQGATSQPVPMIAVITARKTSQCSAVPRRLLSAPASARAQTAQRVRREAARRCRSRDTGRPAAPRAVPAAPGAAVRWAGGERPGGGAARPAGGVAGRRRSGRRPRRQEAGSREPWRSGSCGPPDEDMGTRVPEDAREAGIRRCWRGDRARRRVSGGLRGRGVRSAEGWDGRPRAPLRRLRAACRRRGHRRGRRLSA